MNGIKVLVYSKAGIGKTVLASTAPSPIILSAESGLLSLRDHDIPVIEINNITDLTEAFTWCEKNAVKNGFETVCLDSITEIAEQVLAHAKGQVKDPRQAYGELIEKMNMTIKSFRDLKGVNVYMSAKEERSKDEGSGIVLAGPSMPGAKLGQQLPYLFDEVFNLNIGQDGEGNTYRYLRTQPNLQYDAKDRSGSLDEIEYPDLTQIFNKILGE